MLPAVTNCEDVQSICQDGISVAGKAGQDTFVTKSVESALEEARDPFTISLFPRDFMEQSQSHDTVDIDN